MSEYKHYLNDREVENFPHPSSVDGSYRIYHPNGQLLYERFIQKGCAQGLVREWYPNGQLMYEYFCLNGCYYGLYRKWYEDGLLQCGTIFVNGEERPDLMELDMRLARVIIFGRDILNA